MITGFPSIFIHHDHGSAEEVFQHFCAGFLKISVELIMEMWRRSVSAWIGQIFACMGGCLGCCTKPSPIIAADEPSKGPRIQSRSVKKKPAIVSDDFWSTSTYEMDSSAFQSQRSISSIISSIQNFDPASGPGSSSGPPEFLNHGLLLWNQTRQQWVGSKKVEHRSQKVQEHRLSWNATYESLLGTNKPFAQRIPLSEMVDFLVDVWEQEGMYD